MGSAHKTVCNIQQHWYKPRFTWLTCLLLPFSFLFQMVVFIRRFFITPYKSSLPVVVVGNLTVGGTGKTPLVISLADTLMAKGFQPAVVLRGYKGSAVTPIMVDNESSCSLVGDEALLLARRLRCPIVVCKDRVAAIKHIEKNTQCDIVISDDGLQHYALARDVEILIIDGMRRLGNGAMLPAGPLRESQKRLASVDFVVTNGKPLPGEFGMHVQPTEFVSVANDEVTRPLESLKGETVHAVAGIGNPDRFFHMLKCLDLQVTEHSFPDHHAFTQKDVDHAGFVIMTEKDAVKCKGFSDERHWFCRINAHTDAALIHQLLLQLEGRLNED